jgi:hypothetical protein
MMDLSIKVKQGEVHINSITVFRQEENLILFSIDCREKHPDVDCVDYDEDNLSLNLSYCDKALDNNTRVSLKGYGAEWCVLFSTGRYTVNVALVRRTNEQVKQFVFGRTK